MRHASLHKKSTKSLVFSLIMHSIPWKCNMALKSAHINRDTSLKHSLIEESLLCAHVPKLQIT
jgi:hypothetical protein